MDAETLGGHGYSGVAISPNGVFIALFENKRKLFHYKKDAIDFHGEVCFHGGDYQDYHDWKTTLLRQKILEVSSRKMSFKTVGLHGLLFDFFTNWTKEIKPQSPRPRDVHRFWLSK